MHRLEHIVNPFNNAPVLYIDEAGSTLEIAHQIVKGEHQSGTVIQAGYQLRGRGRFPERKWESRRNKNLLFSIIFDAGDVPVKATLLPLILGLSVCESLENLFGIVSELKWPNDVLIRGKKVCGNLCELKDEVYITGTGINCNESGLSGSLGVPAVSIQETVGEEISRDNLLREFLRVLYSLLNSRDIQAKINSRLFMKNGPVRLLQGFPGEGELIEGRILGISDDGGLLFSRGGEESVIYSGELLVRGP